MTPLIDVFLLINLFFFILIVKLDAHDPVRPVLLTLRNVVRERTGEALEREVKNGKLQCINFLAIKQIHSIVFIHFSILLTT